jgi:hypothetical protein
MFRTLSALQDAHALHKAGFQDLEAKLREELDGRSGDMVASHRAALESVDAELEGERRHEQLKHEVVSLGDGRFNCPSASSRRDGHALVGTSPVADLYRKTSESAVKIRNGAVAARLQNRAHFSLPLAGGAGNKKTWNCEKQTSIKKGEKMWGEVV